jgi:hypothetical protein
VPFPPDKFVGTAKVWAAAIGSTSPRAHGQSCGVATLTSIRNSGHYGIGYDKGANPQIAVNNRGQVVRSRCARKSENDLVDGGLEISTEPQSGCPIGGKPTGSVSQAADSVCQLPHPKIGNHTHFLFEILLACN